MSDNMRLLISRLLIGIVFFWNVQCAIVFLLWPERYAPGFELSGAAGEAAIRGIGVLFLMWNVPYAVALWHPVRHRLSLYESTAMQAIGVFGESMIYLTMPAGHMISRLNLGRFILFDAAGLVLLLASIWITSRRYSKL